jgi:hypothetical protein
MQDCRLARGQRPLEGSLKPLSRLDPLAVAANGTVTSAYGSSRNWHGVQSAVGF